MIIIKRFLAAFFVLFIYRPGRFILRLIFYKIVVRFYKYYIGTLKRIGWAGKARQSVISFLFNQKLVHIVVILITTLLLFINLTTKTKAGGLTEKAHKTILSDLIKTEFSEFYEDEQLVIETFDQETVISSVQQSYLDSLSSMKAQQKVIMDDDFEEKDLSVAPDGASIIKPDIAKTTRSVKPRKEAIKYEVKPGDTISTIAENFAINVSTILWENNLSAYSIIRPGNKLKILPDSGINHSVASGDTISSIAKKYSVEEKEILEANKMTSASTLKISEELFIPGGRKITYASYTPKSYTGITAIRDIVKAPDAKPVPSNKMNWPTVGSRISQYYTWKHHAVDIANKNGTPIYAADSGTVEYIGWGKGYGNQIVVNHGGGKKTRYAHLSKFYVKKDEKISKGQTIAAMGSTGWSTGSHLHFEVIINGKKYNPLNYIK